MKNPIVYEINTRVWLRQFVKGKKNTKINEIPTEYWLSLIEKGVDAIWLMGVWSICRPTIEKYCFESFYITNYKDSLKDWRHIDVIGSPYAIEDYTINSEIGTEEEILSLKAKLNELGLKLILDFIPNHYGTDTHLIKKHPEIFLEGTYENLSTDSGTFFYHKDTDRIFAHGRDPFFMAWRDTIQLNYFKQETRDYMTKQLIRVSELCDGVRCDMAMLNLSYVFGNTWRGVSEQYEFTKPEGEFWKKAISDVKQTKNDFFFIAEAYWDLESALIKIGFDYAYDKRLYDRMKDGCAEDVASHLHADLSYQEKCARFIENHDEDRASKAFGTEKSTAAALIVSTLPGMKIFFDGQFEGKKIKLPLQLGREPEEKINSYIAFFYDKLYPIMSSKIFKHGAWELLEVENSWNNNFTSKNILAWRWTYKNENRIVVVNLSNNNASARIKFSTPAYVEKFTLEDILNNKTYERDVTEIRDKGLFVDLKAWKSHIFKF